MNETPAPISAFAAYSQMNKMNKEHIIKPKKTKSFKKLKPDISISLVSSPDESEVKQTKNVAPVVKKKKILNSSTKFNVELEHTKNFSPEVKKRKILESTTSKINNETKSINPKRKIKKLVQNKIETFNLARSNEGSGSEKEFLPKKQAKRKEICTSTESLISRPNKKKKNTNLTSSNDESNKTPEEVETHNDSTKIGKMTFEWIIHPITVENFFTKTWEKRPAYVQRTCPSYYESLISTKQIDSILRNNNLFFGRNLDVTKYANGKRRTFNPEGRALPPVVWDYYSNGCSVRLLNPQIYSKKLQKIITYLQEFFGSFVGANAYLTPPGTQGFAPHYDDIEAFILQIEGKKHWKLYAPRNKDEMLPRYSSPNFSEEDLTEPPVLELTLEAGDIMYFPRGTIHQGYCMDDEHSLHVTLSFYQKLSWGDYLEKFIPMSLQLAIESDPEFREGLPLHFADFMGMVHVGDDSDKRESFCKKLESLLGKLFKRAPVDSVIDLMSKEFQHTAMPPILTAEEKALTAYGDGERMVEGGIVTNRVIIDMDTKVKLLRRHILRLVYEDNLLRIYHYAYNSKKYQGEDLQFFEIDKDLAPGVEMLVKKYPEYIAASELPIENEATRIQIVADLWERGLLMTETPLPSD